MTEPKKRTTSGAAVTGAGVVTTATGLAAGGIPGAKADVRPFTQPKPGVRGQARKAKAFPGGILGFRHNAHAGGIYGYKQQATENAWKGPTEHADEAYHRGRIEGKIPPEETVLRQLKGAKKGAGAALLGGAALTAYGVHRMATPKKVKQKKLEELQKKRHDAEYSSAALGVGGTAFGVSHGAHHVLRGQEKTWAGAAADNVATAHRLLPTLPGQGHSESAIKRGEAEVKRNPHAFKGVPPNVAQEAGRLRGSAIQHAHFASVYGDTAKTVGRLRGPSAVLAGAGAGGLVVASREKKKKSKLVKRNLARDLGVGVAAGTLSGVIANQIPQNQKASAMSRKLREEKKKREEIKKSPWGQVGRGSVVHASKMHPAWMTNAVVNHPTATATGALAVGGAASQAPRFEKDRSPEKERAADVAAGAAVGAGAGIGVDRAAFYTLKHEYKKPKYNGGTKAQRRAVKAVKAESAAKFPDHPRQAEDYKNRHYPADAPGGKLRRISARHTGGKNAALLAGVGAATGVGLAVAHNRKKHTVEKSAFGVSHEIGKTLSQPQIDRRKKAQAKISIATATLGLGGLGLLGAAHVGPKAVRASAKGAAASGRIKPLVNERKLDDFHRKGVEGAKTVGVISGGIGGLGGYNFASYTKAEAEQRKRAQKKLTPGL